MRLSVLKTHKLYIDGAFPRGESGRVFPARSPDGAILARVCRASRKDLRAAVVAARKAFPGWSNRAAFNRGQILYRMAEILEGRSGEMVRELQRSVGMTFAGAHREVTASVDRLVWYAGWADKLTSFLGSVNAVASPHFNFSVPEPTGVVGLLAPEVPSLLGLVSLMAPTITSGNTVVTLVSESHPLPAVIFSEILATSDLPDGVVNVLTGFRSEIAPHLAKHMDINAIVDASGDRTIAQLVREEAACNVKRIHNRQLQLMEWFGQKGQDPYCMLDTLEIKTTWHPVGW